MTDDINCSESTPFIFLHFLFIVMYLHVCICNLKTVPKNGFGELQRLVFAEEKSCFGFYLTVLCRLFSNPALCNRPVEATESKLHIQLFAHIFYIFNYALYTKIPEIFNGNL